MNSNPTGLAGYLNTPLVDGQTLEPVTAKLLPGTRARLDAIAAESGVSRSTLIRRIIDSFIDEEHDRSDG